MPNPRELDNRRKSIRNIRKITRTMELIATARFKKAMDRAHAATAYTERMTRLVSDLTRTGLSVTHPLLVPRDEVRRGTMLVLTANRGLCGGYNSNLVRLAMSQWGEFDRELPERRIEIAGKRGVTGLGFRGIEADETYLHFEDRPAFEEVEVIANAYLDQYVTGQLDRLDVIYTQFESAGRQRATVETLLPLSELGGTDEEQSSSQQLYEFLPSPESILEEVVPASFKIKLFKCFLDAAVSEQIARMVAMKSATENAGDLIRSLSMQYNRARQGQITSELMDVIGGAEAVG